MVRELLLLGQDCGAFPAIRDAVALLRDIKKNGWENMIATEVSRLVANEKEVRELLHWFVRFYGAQQYQQVTKRLFVPCHAIYSMYFSSLYGDCWDRASTIAPNHLYSFSFCGCYGHRCGLRLYLFLVQAGVMLGEVFGVLLKPLLPQYAEQAGDGGISII